MSLKGASSVQRAIKIYARIKPTTSRNAAQNYDVFSSENDEEVLAIAIKQNPEDGYINNKPEQHSFRFTKVFDRPCTQDKIFYEVAKPVIDSALLGYNGTIFAYGQTGSGKTFTMTGSRTEYEKRGIIPRTLSYVFKHFEEFKDGSKIRAAFVSYLEIYNEGGYDLLHSTEMTGRLEDLGKVTLLEDGHQQMHLRNLSVHPINSEEEALQLLYLGDYNRTVAETPLNEASTRSHCIFTIHLNVREPNTSIVRRSKLHLVDLAGSERVSNSSMSGQLLTEARHINLALHYLEQVIVALSDTHRQHIPYRNSMMTSVLRDSLGGNCMTSMIATLAMENGNLMESLSTCRFSQRVAMVTNAATPNEELDPNLVIQQLKAEVKKLRETIACSSVSPAKEQASPLSNEEYLDCCSIVERFLKDPDSNAFLPVAPDMRLIQTCFRLLKSAYQSTNKMKALTPSVNSVRPISECSSTAASPPGHLPGAGRPRTEMSPNELLQTINRRDIEIKVLVEMLRKEKLKRGLYSRESSGDTAHPTPVNTSTPAEVTSFTDSKASPRADNQQDSETTISQAVNMSEVKKVALNEFLEGYPMRLKLEQLKADIQKKREEVITLQNTINCNQNNMGSLSELYNKMAQGMNSDSENLKNALDSQERTCIMQTQRLSAIKSELAEQCNALKTLYAQALKDFEMWWNHRSKHDCSPLDRIGKALTQPEVETKKGFTYTTSSPEPPQIKVESPRIRSSTGYLRSPRAKKNEEEKAHAQEEADDSLENSNIPLTGDPTTDKEIIKFYKARKKAALKLKQAALS